LRATPRTGRRQPNNAIGGEFHSHRCKDDAQVVLSRITEVLVGFTSFCPSESALATISYVSETANSGAPADRLRPTGVRWTHIALPCVDLDASIEWYTTYTPLELLDRRADADGQGAWLGHPDQGDKPFVRVLISVVREQSMGPQPILAPFAHIGIEMPTKQAVDEIAARGQVAGCLQWPPTLMPQPIGYVCALTDPDGNMIEFSYDQGVYEKAQEVWG